MDKIHKNANKKEWKKLKTLPSKNMTIFDVLEPHKVCVCCAVFTVCSWPLVVRIEKR